ncbi:Holliday junction resolvase RuvX [Adhaeribacter aquaticus]|uniref:Holliday junction resolvase RuvX n=1 Tax=Adhaeribacter aquaticus TaxID=299567 RepID=UPI00040A0B1D|nr:Holliday junction resolvase RuvX [Adhaeribacter aquaticus]
MARVLAIDYGNKRVGLAVTDPLKLIANPLDTVHAKDVIMFLKNYIQKEAVEAFVVGMPKTLDNTPTDVTSAVVGFVRKLKKEIPEIPVYTVDERFTSRMAFQAMIDGGVKKKDRQNKATVDKVSATIILQSYLAQQSL